MPGSLEIQAELVRRLVGEQFPRWADLSVVPVARGGHDNRTFHLGREKIVRLPSGKEYVPQIEKEAKWLPYLAERLTLPVPFPLAQGKPGAGYPFPWSVNRYVEGELLNGGSVPDMRRFAADLADFLRELQGIDPHGGPAAGEHTFFRGASPMVYGEQTEAALKELKKELPARRLWEIWEAAAVKPERPPVWLHGDIAPGNLLVRDGTLCGVIDFGIMGVGDPACDYAMAWSFFDSGGREVFLRGLDEGTAARARGWALWKALITYRSPDASFAASARHTIREILLESGMNMGFDHSSTI